VKGPSIKQYFNGEVSYQVFAKLSLTCFLFKGLPLLVFFPSAKSEDKMSDTGNEEACGYGVKTSIKPPIFFRNRTPRMWLMRERTGVRKS
jgi:hypothetical protein